jgi:hypothetical protein
MYKEGQYVILKRNVSEDIGVPADFFEKCSSKAHKIFETSKGVYTRYFMVNGFYVKERHIDKVVTPEENPEYFI